MQAVMTETVGLVQLEHRGIPSPWKGRWRRYGAEWGFRDRFVELFDDLCPPQTGVRIT